MRVAHATVLKEEAYANTHTHTHTHTTTHTHRLPGLGAAAAETFPAKGQHLVSTSERALKKTPAPGVHAE